MHFSWLLKRAIRIAEAGFSGGFGISFGAGAEMLQFVFPVVAPPRNNSLPCPENQLLPPILQLFNNAEN